MYQSYSLSRHFDDDLPHSTSFTVADDDAINCAHMLAAGFNTLSRNMMNGWVLAVVDTKAGTVQYDGKIEQIKRADPWSYEQSFTFEPSSAEEGDTLLRMFTGDGKTAFSAFGKVSVEEEGPYEPEHAEANASARDELIKHVKGAYEKWSRIDPERERDDLKSHLRGMIEVLSKYLVAIGEADADERHAVALRVCEIPEGNYLYDDA